jgi:ATP-dependent Clp protease adaptor protein ClpS
MAKLSEHVRLLVANYRSDNWRRKHMARLSRKHLSMVRVCVAEIQQFQRGPASLLLLRLLMSDQRVRHVVEQLGAEPSDIVRDANLTISDGIGEASELTKPLWSVVGDAMVHSKSSSIAEVGAIELLAALAGQTHVAEILGTRQISRYSIICIAQDRNQTQLSWWQKVVDARRLAGLPPLQRDHCHILMHNDGYTTTNFVMEVLQQHFGFTESTALKVTTLIHKSRWQRIATFTADDATSTIATIAALAKANQFPLRLSTYPGIAAARLVAGANETRA